MPLTSGGVSSADRRHAAGRQHWPQSGRGSAPDRRRPLHHSAACRLAGQTMRSPHVRPARCRAVARGLMGRADRAGSMCSGTTATNVSSHWSRACGRAVTRMRHGPSQPRRRTSAVRQVRGTDSDTSWRCTRWQDRAGRGRHACPGRLHVCQCPVVAVVSPPTCCLPLPLHSPAAAERHRVKHVYPYTTFVH